MIVLLAGELLELSMIRGYILLGSFYPLRHIVPVAMIGPRSFDRLYYIVEVIVPRSLRSVLA